jgi:hypothetical protein
MKHYFATARLQQATDGAQNCGLSSTVWPDDAGERPLLNYKIHSLEDITPAIASKNIH